MTRPWSAVQKKTQSEHDYNVHNLYMLGSYRFVGIVYILQQTEIPEFFIFASFSGDFFGMGKQYLLTTIHFTIMV
jgi:hypothetical protein